MIIRCANPTCADRLPGDWMVMLYPEQLEHFGWELERQPGDDLPRPYCPRCKL